MDYATLVTTLVGAVMTAVGALFLAYRQSTESTLAEVKSQRDVYRSIADRSVERLEQEVNDRRQQVGLPPIIPMTSVVPEHHSPITEAQEQTATAATLRARLVAAELASTLITLD